MLAPLLPVHLSILTSIHPSPQDLSTLSLEELEAELARRKK